MQIKNIFKIFKDISKSSKDEIKKRIFDLKQVSPIHIYPDSIHQAGDAILMIVSDSKGKSLLIISEKKRGIITDFSGILLEDNGIFAKKTNLNAENAALIRKFFPWTAPSSLKKKKTTIGCGDRLGNATIGHIAAIRKFEASPVLAQQSIRELTLTGRTYRNVIDDVTFQVFQEDFTEDFGADADHIKKIEDLNSAIDEGVTMITLDLSDHLKTHFAFTSVDEINSSFENLPFETKQRIKDMYFGRTVQAGSFTFNISELDAKRSALIFLDAMSFTESVQKAIKKKKNDNLDLEISIDETSFPTSIIDHFFIINELEARKIDFISIAPKFVGEFQKAIDYIGDLKIFQEQFEKHSELARHYGNYKISIHSGSDKFSIFPIIGKLTSSRFHLKTAGTSWLEALRTISLTNPALYRKIHSLALHIFPEANKLYHLSPNLSKIKPLDSVPDNQLIDYLEDKDSRQVLHVSYGAVLSDKKLKEELFSTLHKNEKIYLEKLDQHFTKHLADLGIKRRDI